MMFFIDHGHQHIGKEKSAWDTLQYFGELFSLHQPIWRICIFYPGSKNKEKHKPQYSCHKNPGKPIFSLLPVADKKPALLTFFPKLPEFLRKCLAV